jgi:hypothetical protein
MSIEDSDLSPVVAIRSDEGLMSLCGLVSIMRLDRIKHNIQCHMKVLVVHRPLVFRRQRADSEK